MQMYNTFWTATHQRICRHAPLIMIRLAHAVDVLANQCHYLHGISHSGSVCTVSKKRSSPSLAESTPQ